MRRYPLFKLTSAGVDFCDAYLRLAIPDRRRVEDYLLCQAFLPNQGDPGGWGYNHFSAADRMDSFMQLRKISHDLADAWLPWANEISRARPSQLASRDAILALMGRMVFLKIREAVEAGVCHYLPVEVL